MAKRTEPDFAPDAGDIDGQNGRLGIEDTTSAVELGGPIDPIGLAAGGDDYARNDDGTIKLKRDGTPQRKRGRKAGGGTARTNTVFRGTKNNQDLVSALETLSLTIGGVHLALAAVSKTPELKLDDSEALALAKAAANVMEQFDMTPDPRFVAVGGLITTCATIYGPRAYLISERRKEAKKETQANSLPTGVTKDGANVVPIFDPSQFNFTGNS